MREFVLAVAVLIALLFTAGIAAGAWTLHDINQIEIPTQED